MMPDAVVLIAVLTPDCAEESVDAGSFDDSDCDTDTDAAPTAVTSITSTVSSQGECEAGLGPVEGRCLHKAGGEEIEEHMMGEASSISELGDSTDSDSADEVEKLEETLVGTLELAFSQAVRSNFLTLNPPLDGAYLSNMCTAVEYRQRGFGKELLAAAEQLTRLTAYRQIYLHNRWVPL